MCRTITNISNIIFVVLLVSCKESEVIEQGDTNESLVKPLVEAINKKSKPLSTLGSLSWTDTELFFLDAMAENTIIGLGEATHGTSEFFEAKHRMFRYLVENHDFRIFGIEADFGESILINEAIQNGNCEELKYLMKEHMLFWTWHTEEVKNMLEWMCSYNLDKSDEDKIQYFGFDSQSNRHNPGILLNYLNDSKVDFFKDDISILQRIIELDANDYEDYNEAEASNYLDELDALINSLETNESEFIKATSAPEFQLNFQLLKIVRQVVDVRTSEEPWLRDKYMAENASWLSTHFNNKKVVLWAHNAHVAKDESYLDGGSMGYHLSIVFPDSYESLVFLFSTGSFTAVTQIGSQFVALETQRINSDALKNSVNRLCNQAEHPIFYVNTTELEVFYEWNNHSLTYFDIGSSFWGMVDIFYKPFYNHRYDHMIYFDESTESELLPR